MVAVATPGPLVAPRVPASTAPDPDAPAFGAVLRRSLAARAGDDRGPGAPGGRVAPPRSRTPDGRGELDPAGPTAEPDGITPAAAHSPDEPALGDAAHGKRAEAPPADAEDATPASVTGPLSAAQVAVLTAGAIVASRAMPVAAVMVSGSAPDGAGEAASPFDTAFRGSAMDAAPAMPAAPSASASAMATRGAPQPPSSAHAGTTPVPDASGSVSKMRTAPAEARSTRSAEPAAAEPEPVDAGVGAAGSQAAGTDAHGAVVATADGQRAASDPIPDLSMATARGQDAPAGFDPRARTYTTREPETARTSTPAGHAVPPVAGDTGSGYAPPPVLRADAAWEAFGGSGDDTMPGAPSGVEGSTPRTPPRLVNAQGTAMHAVAPLSSGMAVAGPRSESLDAGRGQDGGALGAGSHAATGGAASLAGTPTADSSRMSRGSAAPAPPSSVKSAAGGVAAAVGATDASSARPVLPTRGDTARAQSPRGWETREGAGVPDPDGVEPTRERQTGEMAPGRVAPFGAGAVMAAALPAPGAKGDPAAASAPGQSRPPVPATASTWGSTGTGTAGAGSAGSGRTVDQVASALALDVREGRTEATITLRPAALGEVKVKIASGQDGVVIHIAAERDAVGELLRSRVAELRDALVHHQVPVAELHVLHNPPAPLPADHERPAWQDRPAERREHDGGSDERPPGRGEQDETETE